MSSPYRPPFAVAASPMRLVFAPPLLVLTASHPEPADTQLTVGNGTLGTAARLLAPLEAPSFGSDAGFVAAAAALAPTAAMTLLVCRASVRTPRCSCAEPDGPNALVCTAVLAAAAVGPATANADPMTKPAEAAKNAKRCLVRGPLARPSDPSKDSSFRCVVAMLALLPDRLSGKCAQVSKRTLVLKL